MDDFPRFQFDEEESKKWTKEKIGHLEEIAGPNLCRVMAQERFPVLTTRSKWRERASSTSEEFV